MTYNAFLFPEVIQDTPRLFTALAEWLAIFVYFNIYRRSYTGVKYVISCILSLAAIVAFQFVAGLLSIWFWIGTMIVAVLLMYFALFTVLDIKVRDCGVLTIHAFVLAEFAASLYRQLYVWLTFLIGKDIFVFSTLTMLLTYSVVYIVYFLVEKENFPEGAHLNITHREYMSVFMTGVGAFIMSNLSFVWTSTPFSDTGNLLYVRTLVDFGGMLMLMTQMGRRNEMIIKTESDAIGQLFQRQYEQYKLAVDNSEYLRREMHDMKHYLMALKNEDDPKRRAEVLEDMEQAIAIQEAFMNTGNQVLDVILTTKSLQCQRQKITLNAMVDGEILSHIHVKDICSLFGNILDNAIEATQMVDDLEKRLITLSVRKKNQFVIVECENFSDSHLEKDEALPRSTKGDAAHHGYGLKSIKQVAEKYGGTMTISETDGWFTVKALLSVRR